MCLQQALARLCVQYKITCARDKTINKVQDTEKSSGKLPTETSAESAPASLATVPTGSTETILQLILGHLLLNKKGNECLEHRPS